MAADFDAIKKAAEGYQADMCRFLREMISHPSESCEEKEVAACIREEMEKLGYDRVEIDGLGNVIGWMGEGEKIIAIDAHIDTVGIGNRENWTDDPYEGYDTDEITAPSALIRRRAWGRRTSGRSRTASRASNTGRP